MSSPRRTPTAPPGRRATGIPPGYPSYFVRPVYTRYGNHPGRGATAVIFDPESSSNPAAYRPRIVERAEWKPDETWEQNRARYDERLRRLWKPLPLSHPRTLAWMLRTFQHFKHCYRDVERPEYGKPGTLVYPLPCYKVMESRIDEHWTEEHKRKVREADAQYNAYEDRRARAIATVDNHLAVLAIRRYYPDFDPMIPYGWPGVINADGLHFVTTGQSMVDGYLPPEQPGDWWERCAERPKDAAECEATMQRTRHFLGHHRTEGWCQFCGRTS